VSKQITIVTEWGQETVRASMIAKRFAVHGTLWQIGEKIEISKGFYTVTHIASGRAIFREIQGKQAACEFAEMFANRFSDDCLERLQQGNKQELKSVHKFLEEFKELWPDTYIGH
jgi:hypothetical protein